MKLPKVSVIIPYNKDRGWLNEAIESVENQTYKGEVELILSQSDNRVGYNINRGIERSTGDLIKWFGEDDKLHVDCISRSVSSMEDNDLIHGRAFNFNDSKPSLSYEHTPDMHAPTLEDMLIKNRIHGGTLMYRRDVFRRFGMLNETLWTAEEYEFNLRILSMGAKIGYCDFMLMYNRLHPGQKSIGRHTLEYRRKRKDEIERIKNLYR